MGSAFVKATVAFFIDLIMSLASRAFIEWFFFSVAEKFVKSTKSDVDDNYYHKIKASYEEYMETK